MSASEPQRCPTCGNDADKPEDHADAHIIGPCPSPFHASTPPARSEVEGPKVEYRSFGKSVYQHDLETPRVSEIAECRDAGGAYWLADLLNERLALLDAQRTKQP